MWRLTNRVCCVLLLASLCFLPCSLPATASATGTPGETATVMVSATDLEELQNNLDRLSVLNDSLQQACGRQKNQIIDLQTSLQEAQERLAAAQKQQVALQMQIRTLTENSQKQESLLTEATESFARYSKEQKRTRLRIKAQRNMWEVSAGLLLIGLITK